MQFSIAYCNVLLTFYCVHCYRAQLGHLSYLLVHKRLNYLLDLLQRWQRIRSGSRSHCFFADPDPVLFEDADPDLNLACPPPPQIIWGKISSTFRKDLFFFWSRTEFWQKKCSNFLLTFFFGLYLNFGRKKALIFSNDLFFTF